MTLDEYCKRQDEAERLYDEFWESVAAYDFSNIHIKLNELAGVDAGIEDSLEAYIENVTSDIPSNELKGVDEYVRDYLESEDVTDDIINLKFPDGVDDAYYDSEEYDNILNELHALAYDIPNDELEFKLSNDKEYQKEREAQAKLEEQFLGL